MAHLKPRRLFISTYIHTHILSELIQLKIHTCRSSLSVAYHILHYFLVESRTVLQPVIVSRYVVSVYTYVRTLFCMAEQWEVFIIPNRAHLKFSKDAGNLIFFSISSPWGKK